MPDPELLLRKVSIAGFTLTHERGMIAESSRIGIARRV
jgi:hypothetical protein